MLLKFFNHFHNYTQAVLINLSIYQPF